MIKVALYSKDWEIRPGGQSREYEVVERDVRGMRGLVPEKFRWTMNWPLKVLEGEIVLKRGGTAGLE